MWSFKKSQTILTNYMNLLNFHCCLNERVRVLQISLQFRLLKSKLLNFDTQILHRLTERKLMKSATA